MSKPDKGRAGMKSDANRMKSNANTPRYTACLPYLKLVFPMEEVPQGSDSDPYEVLLPEWGQKQWSMFGPQAGMSKLDGVCRIDSTEQNPGQNCTAVCCLREPAVYCVLDM